MVRIQPLRFEGSPVVPITATPPAGTPSSPVAWFRIGTCRVGWPGIAAVTEKAALKVLNCKPLTTLTVVDCADAPGFTATLTYRSDGLTTHTRSTVISLDRNPTAIWPLTKFVL